MDARFARMAQILAILLIAKSHLCVAQSIIDRAPSGRPDEIAVTGDSRRVEVETNVPLPALIQRLEGNWELEETGKAYWIGYTKDMYSIASHGEQAVTPLVEFIRNTSSDHAREGALLSLHLIGIKSPIVGRFEEEFSSKSVREAFYGFLEDARLRDEVLLLLVRDPWPSDVPHLMKALAQENDTNCQPTVNALFRYALNCPAFGGTLAKDVSGARVLIVEGKQTNEIGQLVVFTEERPNEGVDRINQLNSSDKDIVIQWRSDGGGKFGSSPIPKQLAGISPHIFEIATSVKSPIRRLGRKILLSDFATFGIPLTFKYRGRTYSLSIPQRQKRAGWSGGKSNRTTKRVRSDSPEKIVQKTGPSGFVQRQANPQQRLNLVSDICDMPY